MIEKIKNSTELQLNTKYLFAHGFYWMTMCCSVSFASAYLTGMGYSTSSIGFFLAVSFLLATFLQQIISTAADNVKIINVIEITAGLSFLQALTFLFQVGFDSKNAGLAFLFICNVTIVTILQPLLNATNFYIKRHGFTMNFGLARAGGSFFFFIISIIVGNLMNLISVKAAPLVGFIITLLLVADLLWIDYDLKGLKAKTCGHEYDPFLGDANNDFSLEFLKSFIAKYKSFFIFLLGLICYYFGHVVINNFFYQIVVNCGGNTGDNGGILAVQAIVELPAMIFFDKLRNRYGTRILLSVAGIAFVIKIILTAMATTVSMLYVSVLFQSLSFAILIPAAVHLVDEIMDVKDAVKGQGYFTIALTIGNLLSSIIGGVLINLVGVTAALWFGTIVSIVGAVISIYGLFRINIKNQIY